MDLRWPDFDRLGISAEATMAQLIATLMMERIPHEGSWFAPAFRSADASGIYGLVTKRDFSALHRLTGDEIWHFYTGDPLEMLLLHPDGRGEIAVLGPGRLAGQRSEVLVPRGVWQGARPIGPGDDPYTFFGATVTPAFEYSSYDPGYREELRARYPAFVDMIEKLTRDDQSGTR